MNAVYLRKGGNGDFSLFNDIPLIGLAEDKRDRFLGWSFIDNDLKKLLRNREPAFELRQSILEDRSGYDRDVLFSARPSSHPFLKAPPSIPI